jgi:hypothetical protein
MGARNFRERLDSLREAFYPFHGLGVDAFYPVMVRPALGFAMVPKPRERPDPEPAVEIAEALLRGDLLPKMADPEGAAPGLVDGEKFDSTPDQGQARRGLHGMSARGAATVEDLCALVRQDGPVYGMWTVTLPHEVAEELDRIPDGWRLFQDVIRRTFAQALKRACAREAKACRSPVPDHWWYVVEPQQSGRPHLHFVFRCKARRGRRWLLGKGQLDRLIRGAFRSVCGTAYPANAAGNVQALRKDPGSYLSKYLRKEAIRNAAEAILRGGWSGNLIPHQWWGCSRSALAFLRDYRFPLPSYVVGWLSKQWPLLNAMGLLKAGIWQPPGDGAPSVVTGRWFGIDGLEQMIRHLFDLAERAYPSGRTFGYT